ncbi:phage portal protein [Candidatus Termititenax aidoneus]|uniref:Phage portal protein n=1 Tax=Termititenax aidoneus TaxID=2218524 RepID=A0A388TA95_TERA1|nr:phage portal protein [Candidatus Termititenax aidoneus]
MSFFDNFFSKKNAVSTTEKTSHMPLRRTEAGGEAIKPEISDIFRGKSDKYNLAAGFAYPFISIPARLAGCPVVDNAKAQEILLDTSETINKTSMINGTAWRWARWSDKLQQIVVEEIADAAIGSEGLDCDPDTGEILAVHTCEEITTYADGQPLVSERKRKITRNEITIEWRGYKTEKTVTRNSFGFLPIPFAHDYWEGDWRGTSVYSRIIRLLRDNHEIRRNRDQILAQYRPKFIIKTDDYLNFKKNNTDEKGEIKIFDNDIVVMGKDDTVEYLIVSDVVASHTAAIEDNRKEIIMAGGMPEIFGGMLATGNYASTDAQITMGIEYVNSLRRQWTKAYGELANQIATIDAFVNLQSSPAPVTLTWDNLTMASEDTKARIINTYAGAISQLLTNGSVTPDGALFLTKALLPDYPADTTDDLMSGLKKTLTEFTIPSRAQGTFETGEVLDEGDIL